LTDKNTKASSISNKAIANVLNTEIFISSKTA